MNEQMDTLAPINVGSRLRVLRQGRNMSMRALARASGLSSNALSMIERSLSSPSVSTLYKLATALEIPITAFFRTSSERSNVVFRKANERKKVAFTRGIWEGLGGEEFDGRVEPFTLTLEPGATSGQYDMVHTGHEFVMCLEGVLQYEVDDQHYTLEPGDSLLFAAHLSHVWHNPGEKEAKAVFVLCGFEQHERPSEFHVRPDANGSVK